MLLILIKRLKMKRKPLPRFLRGIVLRLYNYTCAHCSKTKHLQINHKDLNPNNNSIDNLEPLCLLCHMVEHPINFQEMLLWNMEKYGVNVLGEL